MTKKKVEQIDAAELRRRAEELLRTKTTEMSAPRTESEAQRLLHELAVHQIELEMQNAELLRARDKAEMALEDYSDLYDFAPVGYFTLNRDRVVQTANLTGATILGIDRARLIGRSFDSFFSPEDRSTIIPFFGKVFENRGKETCNVALLKEGNPPIFVQIEAVADAGQHCRIALIDITERKQAEVAQARLATIVESSNDAIISKDLNGIILSWNGGSECMFGYRADEIIGKSITQLIPSERQEEEEQILRRISAGERIDHFETVRLTKDGKCVNVSVTTSPIKDSHGRIIGASKIARDITERKRVESLVQARLRMLAAAKMSMGDTLQVVLDEIEAQTGSGIGFYHFIDADHETLLLQKWSTKTLRDMCSAEGEGSHYPVSQAGVWVDCVHERRPVIHNDYTSLPNRKGMPPGHAPIIREMVIPILREDRIVAIIGVGNKPTEYNAIDVEIASLLGDFSWEIIDRKIAEEKLRKSEYQLTLAQGIAHIGSWEWDSISDKFTGSNEFNWIFGLILTTYDSFIEQVHPDDRETVNKAVEETLSSQDPYDIYYRIVRPDGFTRIIHARGMAVTDGSGRTIRLIGTAHDVTERKQMENKLESLLSELAGRAFELETANRELESANIGLEAFNYMVAHDLRTPLTNINGYCQVMKNFCAGQNEECGEYIREIYDATLRMDRLIKTLLQFSRTLRAEMHVGTVDLSYMAREVASSLEKVEPERKVTFRITDRIEVSGDANLLHIVLDNLIGNAWKYSGNRDRTEIEFGMSEKEGKQAYFVRDNGPGFDMVYAEKLFTPFQRLPGSDEFNGHGIGLSTVERIIRRHGGLVWAESEPDKGATFYFTLSAG
jgi:PAS domain S-box-containing protein